MLRAKWLGRLCVAACLTVSAAEWSRAADVAQTTEAVAEDLQRWARDLDSDDFNVRQNATRKLSQAGKAAIPYAVKAAESDSLESISRAMEVLKDLFGSADQSTQEAAKAALVKLSESSNKSVARRAKAALTPVAEAPGQPVFGGLVPGGNIQIQVLPAAGAQRIRVANNNGNKEVEVEENGKKIQITETAKDGIKVTVTEKVDGKEKSESYAAKDADELKKKHPEAHKLYEKYAGNNNGAAVVIGNIQINGQALPMQALPIQGRPVFRMKNFKEVQDEISKAQAEITKAAEELQKLAAAGASGEDLKKVAERITKANQQIAESAKKLGE